MKVRRGWWIGVLILTAALAYLLMEEVRAYVIAPLLLALRVEGLVLQALPEALWWLLMIFVIISLGLSQLGFKRQSPEVKNRAEPETISRAQLWARAFRGVAHSRYSRWLLAHRLSNLTVEWIAHQKRISLPEARLLALRGELDMPEQFKAYLSAGLEAPALLPRPFFLKFLLKNRKGGQLPQGFDAGAYLTYLEEKIKHGGAW